MLTVGIHENVRLGEGTEITENGSLVIELIQGSGLSAFESLMDDNAAIDETAKIFVNDFRYRVTKFSSEERKSTKDLVKEIKNFSNFLKEFLNKYATEEDVKKTFSTALIFNELDITTDKELQEALKKDSTFEKVYIELSKAFIKTCEENNLYDADKLFRLKLVRQSADKHFPTFTSYTWEPWIESMAISKEKSEIVFTPSEIKKNKHIATPVASDSTSSEEQTAASIMEPDETVFPDDLDKMQ